MTGGRGSGRLRPLELLRLLARMCASGYRLEIWRVTQRSVETMITCSEFTNLTLRAARGSQGPPLAYVRTHPHSSVVQPLPIVGGE